MLVVCRVVAEFLHVVQLCFQEVSVQIQCILVSRRPYKSRSSLQTSISAPKVKHDRSVPAHQTKCVVERVVSRQVNVWSRGWREGPED